jgi:endonuclease/exonuclease/phosphatase family metal-dependent hydrolase
MELVPFIYKSSFGVLHSLLKKPKKEWIPLVKSPKRDRCITNNSFSLVTLNTWFDAIYNSQRYSKTLENLKSLSPDVICLQECNSTLLKQFLTKDCWIQENFILSDISCTTFEDGMWYGVVMLIKRRRGLTFLSFSKLSLPSKMGRAMIVGKFMVGQQLFVVGTSHFESLQGNELVRKEQFRCATEYLLTLSKDAFTLLCGDCNITNDEQESAHLSSLGWSDCYSVEERSFKYTFGQYQLNHTLPDARLDRILFRSDHKDLTITEFSYFGDEAFLVEEKRIFPSDHLGVYTKCTFRSGIKLLCKYLKNRKKIDIYFLCRFPFAIV